VALIRTKRDLVQATRRIDRIVDAIAEGMFQWSMKEKVDSLETHKRELEADLANAEPPAPVLQHPNLSDVYRDKVANLTEALNGPATKATPIIRPLLESIRLLPRGFGGLEIELVGELAGLLSLGMSQDDKSHPRLRTLKRH